MILISENMITIFVLLSLFLALKWGSFWSCIPGLSYNWVKWNVSPLKWKSCCVIVLSTCIVQNHVNLLVPGRCSCYLLSVIFERRSWIDILSISCEIALKLRSQEHTDDKLPVVQAWSSQATSQYLNWCWPTSVMQFYGITRSQWVKVVNMMAFMLQWLNFRYYKDECVFWQSPVGMWSWYST